MKYKISTLLFLAIVMPYMAMGKTFTDEAGRNVNVPDTPFRVISLAPSVTEIVFEVGYGHRLVGATLYSNYPPVADKLTKVGSYVHLDLEKIVSLKPDLCIGIKDGNSLSVVNRLDRLGIPVYIINPQNISSVIKSVDRLGQILNRKTQSQKIIEGLNQRIKTVKKRLSGIQHRPDVFFQIGISPIIAAGTSTFINDLIDTAGGNNITQGPNPYPKVSREEILHLQPDIIIMTSMVNEENINQLKARWAQWIQIPAVKNNRISILNADIFNRPSTRLVTGLEILARVIHPDRFAVVD